MASGSARTAVKASLTQVVVRALSEEQEEKGKEHKGHRRGRKRSHKNYYEMTQKER
jgi:hypothetical protein